MIIQHNIAALNAGRSLGINNTTTGKNLEKLSSGYRVNRAGDDAAGLAISEKMRGQIRGLAMAEQNAHHGISLIQTAEGGLQETHALLQRMRELAAQSSNGTYDNDVDRANLQKEYEALTVEIDRIAASTNYNGMQLLSGGLSSGFSAGVGGGASFYGIPATQTPGAASSYTASQAILAGIVADTIVPNILNTMLSSMSALTYFADSTIGIGLVFDNGGYNAMVKNTWYSTGNGQLTLSLHIDISFINSVWDSGTNDFKSATDRSFFEGVLAHEMMHAVMCVVSLKGMTSGSGSDIFPTWFAEGMAQTISGDLKYMTTTGLKASPTDANISSLMSQLGSNYDGNYGAGYLACMYLAHLVNGGGAVNGANLLAGVDTILGELASGKSLQTIITTYTSYTSLSNFETAMRSAPTDLRDFVKDLLAATGPTGLGGVLTGNLAATDIVGDTGSTTTFLKVYAGNQTVRNDYPADPLYKMMSGGGRTQDGSPIHPSYAPGAPPNPNPNPNPNPGNRAAGLLLQIGANGSSDQWIVVAIESMDAQSIGSKDSSGTLTVSVAATDILTITNANDALEVLDDAINMVSDQRAELGAAQNRLEHTINNLGVTRENLQAAESAIRDVDMAKEMMEYTKNNILIQASQAMLAQAAKVPEGILGLLR